MSSSAFATFVRDADRLADDPHAVAERLRRLLTEDGWLAPEHRLASRKGYRQHLLHVSESRRLSVVALVWLPGQRTPIHDHVSWCVVGVYRGRERETRSASSRSTAGATWSPWAASTRRPATSRSSCRPSRTSTR